jgi:phosphatidylserine/phosphatidylglycerophosphate/cardiolipin synthase-like enzyme
MVQDVRIIGSTGYGHPRGADSESAVRESGRGIVAPGRNCWRVERADRAALLVDGAAYFASLEQALRSARRSVLILGWDFDGQIRLRPDVDPSESPPLGPLLRSLVERNPELEVHVLVWSIAVVHAPSAPGPLLFGADWQEHPRLRIKLDTQHPLYAAHHQKIVCVDDRIAFVGGMDLTLRRWDTPSHCVPDPHRVQPDGTPYDPVHDVQIVVDGDAAQAIAIEARRRWKAATDEDLAAVETCGDPWPENLPADFTDVRVAIARTLPAWRGQEEVAEVAALTVDALMAARKAIYIEAQYMTAPFVGDVLEEQLAKTQGPDVVVLMTHESHGLAERIVMGNNRDRLIRRLRHADHAGRLRIFYPCVTGSDRQPHQVLIHSKVIVVDDVFLRVGSSNLNNRSIGLDTECDLAIEADRGETRRAIRHLLARLLGEHLGARPEEVERALQAEHGSLARAVDRLNGGARRLATFEAMDSEGPTRPVTGTKVLDPKRPFNPFRLLRARLRGFL